MLDNKDFKILYELDKNAKISLTELTKRTRMSKQNLIYRINKLEKEKVILKYTTIINLHSLGLLSYRTYIRLKKNDEKTIQRIIDYFAKVPETVWVASIFGKWDLEVVFGSKNFIEFDNIIKKAKNNIGKDISKIDFSFSVVNYHFDRDYLTNKKREKFSPRYYGFLPEKIELDETDKKILKEISKDCRQNSSQIGEKIGVSYHTVKKRIIELENRGLIQGYRILIDFNKTKKEYYKVLISLKNISEEKQGEIYSFLASYNFIVYLIEVLGEWNLEIEAEVENIENLNKAIIDLRNKFPEIIEEYNIIKILKEHKLNYLPV